MKVYVYSHSSQSLFEGERDYPSAQDISLADFASPQIAGVSTSLDEAVDRVKRGAYDEHRGTFHNEEDGDGDLGLYPEFVDLTWKVETHMEVVSGGRPNIVLETEIRQEMIVAVIQEIET